MTRAECEVMAATVTGTITIFRTLAEAVAAAKAARFDSWDDRFQVAIVKGGWMVEVRGHEAGGSMFAPPVGFL